MEVKGYCVKLMPDLTVEPVEFFFTSAHRDHWLMSAGVSLPKLA
jgi:hypothetical protein